MKYERITLQDTLQSSIIKLAEGNPGAMQFLVRVATSGEALEIDPYNALGGLGVLLHLDSLGIYGPNIYVLWNDIAERSMVNILTLLRASQLGLCERNVIKSACNRQDMSGKRLLDIPTLLLAVQEELPKFGRNGEEASYD